MRRARGFSLLELMVAMALATSLLVGLLVLFETHSGVTRRQSLTVDLEQSLRIARHALTRACRVAGWGGLPASLAIEVRNNAAPGERIGDPRSPAVVPETDVLIVRGVVEGSMLEISALAPETLILSRRTEGGAEQPLEGLLAAAGDVPGEALLVTGARGSASCSIVELVSAVARGRGVSGEVTELAVEYRTSGTALADGYRRLSAACTRARGSDWMRYVGVLVEMRYFVRSDERQPGGWARHQLARSRFYPGSERPHAEAPRAGVPLVDNALDLQVALAFSQPDDPGARRWHFGGPELPVAPVPPEGPLELVGLSILLRGARPLRHYVSPPLARIEDRWYGEVGAATSVGRSFLRARSSAQIAVRSR